MAAHLSTQDVKTCIPCFRNGSTLDVVPCWSELTDRRPRPAIAFPSVGGPDVPPTLRGVVCLLANDPTVQYKAKGCLACCPQAPVCPEANGCGVRSSAFFESQLFHSNNFVSYISFSLIWPVIISGTQVYGTNRAVVMAILNAFRG